MEREREMAIDLLNYFVYHMMRPKDSLKTVCISFLYR